MSDVRCPMPWDHGVYRQSNGTLFSVLLWHGHLARVRTPNHGQDARATEEPKDGEHAERESLKDIGHRTSDLGHRT
jgi:hypothetical protein